MEFIGACFAVLQESLGFLVLVAAVSTLMPLVVMVLLTLVVLLPEAGCQIMDGCIAGKYQRRNHRNNNHGQFGLKNTVVVLHMVIVNAKDGAIK